MILPGRFDRISVRLEKIPVINLPPVTPPSAAEVTQIKSLIRQLAKISRPDLGLTPNVAGMEFAPILDSEFPDAKVNLRQLSAFVKLVRLGPRALPFLLEALSDATPTKVTFKPGGIVWVMLFSNEVEGNPANARERKILARMPNREDDMSRQERNPSHRITVGDLCFNIIGQIVGRSYEAIRYQPSGNYIVNSPTRDPSIVQAVRAIWSSSNPEQHLMNSLLLDFATRGIHKNKEDEPMSEWSIGNIPQRTAARRLLFYFPRLTSSLVAQRLNQLKVEAVRYTSDADVARWRKRELANGVTAGELVNMVNWCTEPQIRAALLGLFQRAGDSEVLMASLPALSPSQHWSLIERQFEKSFAHVSDSDDGWYGANTKALVALRRLGGDKARSLYHDYLKQRTAQRCFLVCNALEKTRGEWDREFLWPMLVDKRVSMGNYHSIRPDTNNPALLIRVCDAAAEVISKHRKELSFTMVGTKKELDRQIQQIRRQLGLISPG